MALINRSLYFGDNLHILREKFSSNDGYFDLIYLDPPFNSKRDYQVIFKEGIEESPAQIHAFEDSWHWTPKTKAQFDELVTDSRYPQQISDLMAGFEKIIGHNDVMAYLTMMTVRLLELHRVLKSTGSIYLHCDPTASHYLKIVMDVIFGKKNFRNEIIWCYETAGKAKRNFSRKHDVIFFYTKSDKWTFNASAVSIPRKLGKHMKMGVDESGRDYEEKVDKKSGKVYRWYFDEGRLPFDYWTDIQFINREESQRLGYPTQKPEALLERIVKASSNEGDWVLDPFGGCGTAAAAAEKLKRNWVIIDITTLSINLVKHRIEDMYEGLPVPPMYTDGLPEDLAGAKALFEKDPFELEYWVCDLIDARPAGDKKKGKMKGADQGIDGVITFIDQLTGAQTTYKKLLVQVKGGHVGANHIRDFWGTIEREKAVGGIFITLENPTRPMKKDTVEAGEYVYTLSGQKYPKIQILTVEDLLNGKFPKHPPALGYSKKGEKAETTQKTLF